MNQGGLKAFSWHASPALFKGFMVLQKGVNARVHGAVFEHETHGDIGFLNA